jgi:hypothetical protein
MASRYDIFVLSFILVTSILTYVYLSKYYYITYAFGISECASFPDITNCKIIPGSLVFIILKESPLFTVYQSEEHVKILYVAFMILIGLAGMALARGIYDFIGRRIWWSIGYITLFFVLLSSSILLLSGVAMDKDIICYRPTKDSPYTICHTLVEIKDDTFILSPSRYPYITEEVKYDQVVGKVALAIPDMGGVLYLLETSYKLISTLGELVYKGHIPSRIYIEYIIEP